MELEQLISEVKHLLEIENTKKKEKKARGERFNIFSIMRMKTDEVHTHSALIAAMLNPNGPHGSGDMYLNLFLQSVSELHGIDFDTANAKADYEHSIGDINKDKTEGGRTDILIESGKKAIIIENKIYAEDQPKQLLRYENFAKSKYSEYYILYLTLDGKEASNESCKGMSEEYIKVSYRDTIKDWLTKCIEKSATKPLVRETLVQYQNLILKLTHQDMDDAIKKAVVALCDNAENVDTFLWMQKNVDTILMGVLKDVLQPKLEVLAQTYSMRLEINSKGWLEKHKAFSFISEGENHWHTFEITFMFESKELTDLRCGFRFIDANNKGINNAVYDKLSSMSNEKSTPRWPYYYRCRDYSKWKNGNIIASMYDEEGLIKKIECDLKNLLDIVSTNHLTL